MPLYFFMLAVVLTITAFLSHFHTNESGTDILTEVIRWSSSMFGTPDINGIENTWQITAGVIWSLSFEWMFYFSLPLLAIVIFRMRSSFLLLLFCSCTVLLLLYMNRDALYHLFSFVAGICAALMVRIPKLRMMCQKKIISVVIVLLLISLVIFIPGRTVLSIIILFPVFLAIVSGNTLFGILIKKISLTLGEMSYSIYLLHGIVLFTVFRFIIGYETAAGLSFTAYAFLINICAALLILICRFTYSQIESSGIQSTQKITRIVKAQYSRLTGRPVESGVQSGKTNHEI